MSNIFGLLLYLIFLIYLLRSNNFYVKSLEKVTKPKITAIILSYNRLHNLEKSIPILVNYDIIDEIIISHGNPKYYKEFNHPKIKNLQDYQNNNLYKCARRYFNVKHAKNELILFLDDDIVPEEKLIQDMYHQTIRNYDKNTIYGPIKRKCTKKGYETQSDFSNNIILIGLSLTKKTTVLEYLESDVGIKKYKSWLIKNNGNCEDLCYNIFIHEKYNNKPVFVDGNYTWLDHTKGYSDMDEHYEKRDKFCKQYSIQD